MREIHTVGIAGLGALGTIYASILTKACGKEAVFVLADADRIARYEKEGVFYNGERCDFSYRDPSAGAQAALPHIDLVLVCCKYLALPEVIEEIRPAVSDDTILISVLNGIASEGDLRSAFPDCTVVDCMARKMSAVREGTSVTAPVPGELVIGAETPEGKQAVEEVSAFFARTGFPHTVSADIRRDLWSKLLCNTGVNQAAVIYGAVYADLQKDGEPRRKMIEAMREVAAVARAEGVDLDERDVELWVDIMDHLDPAGEPSMRQDAKARRRSEVELFSGTITRLGKKHGVPTPVNDDWYRRITEMEAEYGYKPAEITRSRRQTAL